MHKEGAGKKADESYSCFQSSRTFSLCLIRKDRGFSKGIDQFLILLVRLRRFFWLNLCITPVLNSFFVNAQLRVNIQRKKSGSFLFFYFMQLFTFYSLRFLFFVLVHDYSCTSTFMDLIIFTHGGVI